MKKLKDDLVLAPATRIEEKVQQIKKLKQSLFRFLVRSFPTKSDQPSLEGAKTGDPEDSGYSEEEKRKIVTKRIKHYFNNRLVIIDEVHNMRIADSNKQKLTTTL